MKLYLIYRPENKAFWKGIWLAFVIWAANQEAQNFVCWADTFCNWVEPIPILYILRFSCLGSDGGWAFPPSLIWATKVYISQKNRGKKKKKKVGSGCRHNWTHLKFDRYESFIIHGFPYEPIAVILNYRLKYCFTFLNYLWVSFFVLEFWKVYSSLNFTKVHCYSFLHMNFILGLFL